MSRWSQPRSSRGRDGANPSAVIPAGDGDLPQVRLREPSKPGTPAAPRGRRLLQPMPLLGTLLILVALVGYMAVYRTTTHRTALLITTRSLPAGGVLRYSDVRVGELAGDGSVIAGAVPESDLHAIVGRRLATGLPAGAPLERSALSTAVPAASEMTLAVSALHALAGALEPGDRVTVLATFGAGTGRARTRPVARGLAVLAVGAAPASADPGSATVPVTVALPQPSLASQLALASEDGKLDLVRDGARAAAAAIPPASDSGAGP